MEYIKHKHKAKIKIKEEICKYNNLNKKEKDIYEPEMLENIYNIVMESAYKISTPGEIAKKLLKLDNRKLNLSLREVGECIGIIHPYTISYHLKKLVEAGKLNIIKGRYIKPN